MDPARRMRGFRLRKPGPRRMELALLCAALLAVPGAAAGSQSRDGSAAIPEVSGVVLGEDGTPLRGIQVTAFPSRRSDVTGVDGRFALRGLAAGRHRLDFSGLGYAPAQREVRVDPRSSPARVQVTLRATPLHLPGLHATGTPTGQLVGRGAVQLRGEALDRRVAGDLAHTLGAEPGIAVRYNGPATAPVVRGLTGDRILVLQDGSRSADLSGSADDHATALDPLQARRVEVVRGPSALLYGNNALGGVVNVITGDVPERVPGAPEGSASLRAGTAFPGAAAAARLVAPLSERWALAARAGGRSTGDIRVGDDPVAPGRLPNTHARAAEASAGVGYVGSGAAGGGAVRAHAFRYGLPLPPDDPSEILLEGRLISATARLEASLPSTALPALQGSATFQDYAHEELASGAVEMAFRLRTATLDLLLRQDALGPASSGAWGVSGLIRDYVATGQEQLTAPAATRSAGAFGFQEIPLASWGPSLEAGGRVDVYRIRSADDPRFGPGVERRFAAWSGSAGVRVPLGQPASIGLSLARSFRAPTVEELFSDAPHAGTAAYEVGQPDLRPETSTGGEVVLRAATPRWSGELAAFRSRVADFVHLVTRGDTLVHGASWPVLAYVQQDATLRGAEGRVEWAPSLQWVLTVQGDRVRGALRDGTPLPYMPPARLAASARWSPGAVWVGAAVRHAFAQTRVGSADDVPTDAYTLLDLDAGLRWSDGARTHTLVLRAENAGDRAYRDSASRVKAFAPGPGRNVSLLYRLHF